MGPGDVTPDAATSGDDAGPRVDAPPTEPLPDAAPCVEVRAEATPTVRPADIIWVVDNSGSMDFEEGRVQDNLNTFANTIVAAGIDAHVILITDSTHITIPPPLGGSAAYRAVNQYVDSHDALQLIISTYPQWRDFLRPGSVRHFVVVTDDESDMDNVAFEAALGGLTAPGFSEGFVFHAIVAQDPPWVPSSPCFLISANTGTQYLELQTAHGGVFQSLCQTDWTPVFAALTSAVVSTSQVPCDYAIPPAPPTLDIDLDAIQVESGGTTVPHVTSCSGGPGWTFDDPTSPTRVLLCPASCGSGVPEVQILFGCFADID